MLMTETRGHVASEPLALRPPLRSSLTPGELRGRGPWMIGNRSNPRAGLFLVLWKSKSVHQSTLVAWGDEPEPGAGGTTRHHAAPRGTGL